MVFRITGMSSMSSRTKTWQPSLRNMACRFSCSGLGFCPGALHFHEAYLPITQ